MKRPAPAARLLFAVLALAVVHVAAPVHSRAEAPKRREDYERDLIEESLRTAGLAADPDPQGKIIEEVIVLRHPIVESSDPWPEFVNLFHVVTREAVVRQELLIDEGAVYDEERVRESARNLRALPLLFSTALIVTAKGSRSDRVVLVVITKDLWSIRLNMNGNFGGGIFNYFWMTPSEQNFLGFNQQLSLHYYLDRDVYALGQIYRVPRLWGSRLALLEDLVVRVNQASGRVEGGFGQILLEQPLYAISARWGFFVEGAFDLGIDRIYQGKGIRRITVTADGATYSLPEMYRHRAFSLRAVVARSFGERLKTNLSAGYLLRSRTYDLTEGFRLLPAPVIQIFRSAVVPYDDRSGSLIAAVRFYEPTFKYLQNVQTYGLTEDFQVGLDSELEVSWANPAFGFAQQALRLTLALGYRLALGENLLSMSGQLSARYLPDQQLLNAADDWIDRLAEIQLENISPVLLGCGRLFLRLRYLYSQYSLSRTQFTLGGENTLRGFLSSFRAGPRLFNVNAEFRSLPWVYRTLHLGFVVFYDGGDAYGFTSRTDFHYHQSLGFGIRWLFPQFDRGALRLDVGIPLGSDFHSRVIDWVSIAFLQAF